MVPACAARPDIFFLKKRIGNIMIFQPWHPKKMHIYIAIIITIRKKLHDNNN
jgi:hypothetical protein